VFRSWFKQKTPDAMTLALAVHAAARHPAFYTTLGVPDSFDGRFELLVLHVQLVLRRLRADGNDGADLSQRLFDKVTGHFDEALRAVGVGDMSVGKRVKTMTSALYGRLSAYDGGLDADGHAVLREALRRNVYGTQPGVEDDALDQLTGYVLAADRHLSTCSFEAIQAGRDLFPDPASHWPLDSAGAIAADTDTGAEAGQ
jgi:cytochrome b pre-mRNA-processing protein 3